MNPEKVDCESQNHDDLIGLLEKSTPVTCGLTNVNLKRRNIMSTYLNDLYARYLVGICGIDPRSGSLVVTTSWGVAEVNCYLFNGCTHGILNYDWKFLVQFGTLTSERGCAIRGSAFDPKRSRLMVILENRTMHSISYIDHSVSFVTSLPGPTPEHCIYRKYGMAFDHRGRLWIVDSILECMHVYKEDVPLSHDESSIYYLLPRIGFGSIFFNPIQRVMHLAPADYDQPAMMTIDVETCRTLSIVERDAFSDCRSFTLTSAHKAGSFVGRSMVTGCDNGLKDAGVLYIDSLDVGSNGLIWIAPCDHECLLVLHPSGKLAFCFKVDRLMNSFRLIINRAKDVAMISTGFDHIIAIDTITDLMWMPSTHHLCSGPVKAAVETLLLLRTTESLLDDVFNTKLPKLASFVVLPREILWIIFEMIHDMKRRESKCLANITE